MSMSTRKGVFLDNLGIVIIAGPTNLFLANNILSI